MNTRHAQLIGIALLVLAALAACKSKTDATAAPESKSTVVETSTWPCKVDLFSLSAPETPTGLVEITRQDDNTYLARRDTGLDGVWNVCTTTNLHEGRVINAQLDIGCNGEEVSMTEYTYAEDSNMAVIKHAKDKDMALIVSGKGDSIPEYSTFPLFAPPEALEIEIKDGFVHAATLKASEVTASFAFVYTEAGKIQAVRVDDATVAEFHYNGEGLLTGTDWFHFDMSARLHYECS